MHEIRFDDIEALKARIGEPFCLHGDPVLVSQEMINGFANLTGDHQWIHIDVERARRESPLGTTIAHGFLLISLLPQLRVRRDLNIVGFGSVLNYGADKVRFVNPVPANSSIHCRARLNLVEAKAKGTLVGEELEVSIVGKDKPSLLYNMLYLYLPAAR